MNFLKLLAPLTVVALLATLSGCTHVSPDQRALLAHPSMNLELETAAAGHVHAVHEGAAGGGGVAESGCGCN
jgi:hypothetical protein